MALVLWGVLIVLVLLVLFIFKNRAGRCVLQSPPSTPILGSFLDVLRSTNLADWLNEWSLKFGVTPYEATVFGGLHFLILADSAQAEHLLKTNFPNYCNNTPTHGMLDVGLEFWGRGIFMVDGDEWRLHRKASSHLFSLNALRNKMYSVFYEHTHKLIDILEKQVGQEIDIQVLFSNFTFDTMSEIAFGITPGAMEGGTKPNFLQDFDDGQGHIGNRFQKAPMHWKTERLLGLGAEPAFKRTVARMNAYCLEIIQQRKKAGDLESRGDLLSMFISFGREKNQPELMTDDYLRDVIVNFMVAGRDTTASTLMNMCRGLSDNVTARDKLTKELATVELCGDIQKDVELLTKQSYLRQVLLETLRLYPAVPCMQRFALQDDTMPGNIHVQAGTACFIPILAMNRNPKVWPDPLAFQPERWEGKDLPSEYDMVTFWGGPRICLGRVMAQTEAAVVSGLLARRFKFTVTNKSFTMAPGPVWFYKEGCRALVEKA